VVFTWDDVIKAEGKMPKEKNDLRDRTKDFALRIMRMFSSLPKTTEAQTLSKQALRSGTAAGANCREAYRGRSKAEFISKCGDSFRELEEVSFVSPKSALTTKPAPKAFRQMWKALAPRVVIVGP
jgi:hypothetical protein